MVNSQELKAAMEEMAGRRRDLELEFHQYCKNTSSRPDAFNMIGWLEQKGLLITDRKRAILTAMRDEMNRMGWTETAANIDKVLGV